MTQHDLARLLYMHLTRWECEVNRFDYLMEQAGIEELKGFEAIDAHAAARRLRDMASRVEGMTKDYNERDAA